MAVTRRTGSIASRSRRRRHARAPRHAAAGARSSSARSPAEGARRLAWRARGEHVVCKWQATRRSRGGRAGRSRGAVACTQSRVVPRPKSRLYQAMTRGSTSTPPPLVGSSSAVWARLYRAASSSCACNVCERRPRGGHVTATRWSRGVLMAVTRRARDGHMAPWHGHRRRWPACKRAPSRSHLRPVDWHALGAGEEAAVERKVEAVVPQ